MKTEYIEKLMEKYFEAQTNLQDEKALQEYFSSQEVAGHLLAYKPLFTYISNAKNDKTTCQPKIKRNQSKMLWLSGIAATIVALFTVNFFWQHYQSQKQAEEAMANTKMALQLIAEHFNKGNVAIAELDQINTTKNKIFRIENKNYN